MTGRLSSHSISKGRDGKWEGRDEIKLGVVPGAGDKPLILQLRTDVDSRKGARTFASVLHDNGDGSLSCILFQDFAKTVRTDATVTRGTEKSVTTAHAAALNDLPAIIAEVEAFYAAKQKVAA